MHQSLSLRRICYFPRNDFSVQPVFVYFFYFKSAEAEECWSHISWRVENRSAQLSKASLWSEDNLQIVNIKLDNFSLFKLCSVLARLFHQPSSKNRITGWHTNPRGNREYQTWSEDLRRLETNDWSAAALVNIYDHGNFMRHCQHKLSFRQKRIAPISAVALLNKLNALNLCTLLQQPRYVVGPA